MAELIIPWDINQIDNYDVYFRIYRIIRFDCIDQFYWIYSVYLQSQ